MCQQSTCAPITSYKRTSPNVFCSTQNELPLITPFSTWEYSLFISKIFAGKLKSCEKSHQILDVFLPSQILRRQCPQNCTRFITLTLSTSNGKVSWSHSPYFRCYKRTFGGFKPIFDPPSKKIVRGTLYPMGSVLAGLGHSLTCVKSGGQHPLGAEIWSSESRFGWVRFDLQLSVVHQTFFA